MTERSNVGTGTPREQDRRSKRCEHSNDWRRVGGYAPSHASLYSTLALLGGSAAYAVLAAQATSGLVGYGVVVTGRLSRSGLPTAKGWRSLRSFGVRTLVNLRLRSDDIRKLRELGFQGYLHLPVPDGLPLSSAQARALLDFVGDPGHWPVHLHCLTGVQRSGMAVALVRYSVEGLPAAAVLHEAKAYFPGPTRPQLAWLARWMKEHPPAEWSWRV